MIEFFNYKNKNNPVFSILIPTWNNLELLQFCIRAIEQNSSFEHEIIVHVNENADNTKQWLESKEIKHTFSSKNIGICAAVNAAFSIAQTDYIVYMNDDMYVSPEWDKFLKNEIESLPNHFFYLSASLIEPVFTGNKAVSAPYDFGRDPKSFQEKNFLGKYQQIKISDKNGSSWPPSVMHRQIWNLIGGFSLEFSPGMYSDPDISMKLWKIGVRYFKIVGESKVYHFMSKSTQKVVKNNGRRQFLLKWGMSSSTFYKFYLKMGEPFKGELNTPLENFKLKKKLFFDKVKLVFSF